MAITTKKGDTGNTTINNQTLRKDSDIIELLGALDECSAWLVFVYTKINIEVLKEIVSDVGIISSYIAAYTTDLTVLSERVTFFEKEIDEAPDLKEFYYPFDSNEMATLNLARTSVRKAERCYYRYTQSHNISPLIAKYLNRLSDYLFILQFNVKRL